MWEGCLRLRGLGYAVQRGCFAVQRGRSFAKAARLCGAGEDIVPGKYLIDEQWQACKETLFHGRDTQWVTTDLYELALFHG